MVVETQIIGNTISLMAVREADVNFILKLRTDKITGRFLNPTGNDIEAQKQWIRDQQKRLDDYYFLIVDRSSRPVGTISLYNISGRQGEFGRWICPGNSLYALESVLLIHDFGFDNLGLSTIYSSTNSANRAAINFNKSFGAHYTGERSENPLTGIVVEKAVIYSSDYPQIRRQISTLIEKLL